MSLQMAEDPYSILAESTKRLETPLKQLLDHHDEFVLQNLSILKNVSTQTSMRLDIENALKTKNEVNEEK